MKTNNALIGLAINYEIEDLRNFVLSFRKYNKADTIYLVNSSRMSNSLKNFYYDHNIVRIPFEGADLINTNIINYRWIIYLEFLSINKFNKIFFSDTKDVIFQSDPFAIDKDNFLYFFQEDKSVTIKDCELNYSWCKSLLSENLVIEIQDYPVVCAGTIYGTYDKVINFLTVLKSELIEIKKTNIAFERFSVDQILINFMIRHLMVKELGHEIKINGDIVGSIGHSMLHEKSTDLIKFENNLIFVNDYFPSVVHQYTQYDKLYEEISKIYFDFK